MSPKATQSSLKIDSDFQFCQFKVQWAFKQNISVRCEWKCEYVVLFLKKILKIIIESINNLIRGRSRRQKLVYNKCTLWLALLEHCSAVLRNLCFFRRSRVHWYFVKAETPTSILFTILLLPGDKSNLITICRSDKTFRFLCEAT